MSLPNRSPPAAVGCGPRSGRGDAAGARVVGGIEGGQQVLEALGALAEGGDVAADLGHERGLVAGRGGRVRRLLGGRAAALGDGLDGRHRVGGALCLVVGGVADLLDPLVGPRGVLGDLLEGVDDGLDGLDLVVDVSLRSSGFLDGGLGLGLRLVDERLDLEFQGVFLND